jgi:DtxR family transcriptional regulator, Mn-dependent transcriptional regulator
MLKAMSHQRQPATASRATQEYLVVIRNLISSGQPTTVATVARRLEVTPQAVSEMVTRLRADGLVAPAGGRDIVLTDEGRALADAIFKRHALIEWLLTDVIGMGWAESDHEAHELQTAISDRVESQLDAFLGYPRTCPHGNPIDAATALTRPTGVPLSTLGSGEEATILRITEEAEEDPALLSYLEARGLRPGARIVVRSSSDSLEAITLEGERGTATLGLRPAALIHVLPGAADPSLFHRPPVEVVNRDASLPPTR